MTPGRIGDTVSAPRTDLRDHTREQEAYFLLSGRNADVGRSAALARRCNLVRPPASNPA